MFITAKTRRELELLRKEIERQDNLNPLNHCKGCACWSCIGRLQASVVQAFVRRMRDGTTMVLRDGPTRQGEMGEDQSETTGYRNVSTDDYQAIEGA